MNRVRLILREATFVAMVSALTLCAMALASDAPPAALAAGSYAETSQ